MQVSHEEAVGFATRCLMAAGSTGPAAEDMARLLVAADLAGHPSHGMNRLEFYVNDLLRGFIDSKATPVILNETPATAWVDGKRAMGATVGHFCMDLAIKKAKEMGIGFVSVKGSSHYGMAGYWAEKAEQEGLIGMSLTNTSPVVVPTRSTQYALGTNPIAVAAPSKDGDRFLLDMATSAVAVGKIEMQKRKGEKIPLGWGLNEDGQPTDDPNAVLRSHKLMPLGGAEETSGYKGYGLSMAVEILCGILSGSSYAHKVPHWESTGFVRAQDLGQCFLALDPSAFAPGFQDRMQDMLQHVRNLPRVQADKEILVPGDRRLKTKQSIELRGYIEYGHDQIRSCQALAEKLGVEPFRTSNLDSVL